MSEDLDQKKSACKRGGKKHAMAVTVGICAVAILVYVTYWFLAGRFKESTDDAYVGADIVAIAPKVPGNITRVMVNDNQEVRAGDLLVKLDDEDYKATLARADAAVATRQAAVDNAGAKTFHQESLIKQAGAEMDAARAEFKRSSFDQKRFRELAKARVASEQDLEKAEADFEKAVAAREKAKAAIEAAQRQLDVIRTELRQSQALLEQAIAERDLAALNLKYTELRSPVDGVVGNRSARQGAYAATNGQLMMIVPAHGLWVDANFKENQLAHAKAGQKAIISADILPGKTFTGHLESLAPATGAKFSILPPENATGNFTKIVQRVPVRIALDGNAATLGKLRPGLSVTVTIDRRHTVGGSHDQVSYNH